MSLYGKDDSNANKTKAGIGIAPSSQAKQTIFIDDTEAALAENKARGLNAPGWWSYYTYTDCEGNTRHKAEMLVTIADPEANSSETQSDDSVAADEAVLITINTQPATQAVAVGDPLALSVDAISTPPGDASVISISGRNYLLTIAGQTSVLINPPMMLILMLWKMLVLIESASPLPMVLQKSSPLPL